MGRLSAILLALVLGGASAVALASCGGGSNAELLPGTTADQIEANLDQVDQLVAAGDCIGAEDAVAEVAAEVEELQEVDLELKAALQEGTTRLSEVVGRCEEETAEAAEPTLESDVEAEALEEKKKPKKEKPEKEAKEPPEKPSESEQGPDLPPQSEGKGEENGGGPPTEPEAEETAPSGGVGPGVGVE
jgi:hypothetical protein